MKCMLPVVSEVVEGIAVDVLVGGLLGGHSGAEIHKERGNSNSLFGRLLYRLTSQINVALCEADGGLADNAIPRETKAKIVISPNDLETFGKIVKEVESEIQGELATKDPGAFVKVYLNGQEWSTGQTMPATENNQYTCISPADTKKAAAFLIALPNGVQAMSADMPGLVETSLNMGILKYADGELLAEFSVRSSVESAKEALIEKMFAVTALAGGTNEVTGDYPGWKFRKDSPLREKMVALYEKMYGVSPKVEAIHAGLECGILGSKIKDLDCVSMGPDMKDIHTTEETLSISSTARVWEYLVALLAERD